MAIVIKNSQLNDETISALNTLIDMDINAVSAFRLTRIIKEISSIVEDKVKMEKKILEKWVKKDENGNTLPALDENGSVIEGAVNITDPDSFTKEMSVLMDIENEIPYDKIKFEDLNLKTAKVKDLIKLEFLFDVI
jgi:predicted mannosyl-3-phosphoglycerate phosphatase (HAD superfamily)